LSKEIKERWEKYMYLGEVSRDIKPEVLDSWHRCEAMNVDYTLGKGTRVSNLYLQESLRRRKELISVSRPILENVFHMVKNTGYSLILTDENGVIIDLIINDDIKNIHNNINFVRGSKWDEKNVGTNAIGTCLATDRAVQIVGAEHYCEYHHQWTCSAAPIHNSKGEIIGSFDISGRVENVQAHTRGIALSSANCIEKQLVISESYNLMDTTFDSILDGIMIIDNNLNVLRINNKLPDMFHMSKSDIFKIDIRKILDETTIREDIFVSKRKINFPDITLTVAKKKIECSLNISPIIVEDDVTGAVMLMREAKQVRKEVSKLAGFKANYTFDSIITKDERMEQLINTAKKISKANCSVLIEGESGTGKELYAQSIHNESNRKNCPFVAINCSAIPKELVESELFGYESGSFTGAAKGGRPGKFELAHGGTIFLDEIGEIPMEIQPKLLRVLDNGKITRIGGSLERDLDVRIISATNRNLLEEVTKGSFRQDLYFRLNVINLRIPPLRNRPDDIVELAKYFLRVLNEENCGTCKRFNKKFEKMLIEHEWMGNVRELKNIIQRAYYMTDKECISTVQFPNISVDDRKKEISAKPFTTMKEAEKDIIKKALASNKGNVLKASKELKISKATIYRKIKSYDIDLDKIARLA
jgi:transcriptional regulator of acetoin/glycerol metabolism